MMSNSSTSIKEQNKNMAFTLFRRNIRKFEQNKLAMSLTLAKSRNRKYL